MTSWVFDSLIQWNHVEYVVIDIVKQNVRSSEKLCMTSCASEWGGKLRQKDMGDYLYNSEMGPWACVTVCQAAWSTDGHTEAHLLSLSTLYILSIQDRTLVVLWSFSSCFVWLIYKVNRVLSVSPHSPSWIFCFLLLGFFSLQTDCLLSCVYINPSYSPLLSFSSHLPPFPVSLCVVFGLCYPHPLWFSSLMDCLSTHRQPHAIPA